MSLFKNLVKNLAKKGLEEVTSQLEAKYLKTERNSKAQETVQNPEFVSDEKTTLYTFGGTEEQYFEYIFDCYFKEYVIETKVEAYTLDAYAHNACVPIDYLFYKDGKPVLALLLVKPNNYKGKNIMGTLNICEQAGIPWLRFFRTWENEQEYVVQRIRNQLK